MIARIWSGATRTADADAHRHYTGQVAQPSYADVAGNRGVLTLSRLRGDDRTEFTAITAWDELPTHR